MIDEEKDKANDSISKIDTYDYPSKTSGKSYFPIIAGIILIIAGALALITFIQVLIIDISTLESIIDVTQFQTSEVNLSSAQIKEIMNTCAIIGCIISVFPILGGILSFRKKLWGIALACSIIGLFSFGPMLISSILCLIALIFVAISKQEFQ